MDSQFLAHNLHLEGLELFEKKDPHLSRLKNLGYIYNSYLLQKLPTQIPGIYTLGGGRQIGKSTLLKQWILQLIKKEKVPPKNIAFFSGEMIDDHHNLLQLMQTQLDQINNTLQYLIIDEITYIKNWDKAIKYAADLGYFENTILLLTGSDLILIQEARMRFPGRRGKADQVDFHVYPLSFGEVLKLKSIVLPTDESYDVELLLKEFSNYLLHGGYLTAINDLFSYGKILKATFTTYSDWIRGDMQKRGKQDLYLQEIINAIIKRYNSQITWNSLAKELSIDHHKTVADYIELLASMDAVFVQSALLEDKLLPAPKKAKKVMFTDPFIYHALNAWVNPTHEIHKQQMQAITQDNLLTSKLVEAIVTTHFRRKYPTYYIKGDGEVDIAYIDKNKFWPIEIKWTNQIRTKDLNQISKYPNGKIWAKLDQVNAINGINTYFLPHELAML